MIELKPFLAEMALLSERFGRQPSEALAMRYLQILSEKLTTEQFSRAALEIFTRDTWFPSPERILEAAFGEFASLAETQWLELLEAANADRASNLDTIAKSVIKALGGSSSIKNLRDVDQLLRVRREFVEGYVRKARASITNAPALEAPKAEHAQKPSPDADVVDFDVPDFDFSSWDVTT